MCLVSTFIHITLKIKRGGQWCPISTFIHITLKIRTLEVDKCVQFPHLSTSTLQNEKRWTNVSNFHIYPHHYCWEWKEVDKCVQFHICPHYIIYSWNVDECGQFPILATLHLINIHVARCGQFPIFAILHLIILPWPTVPNWLPPATDLDMIYSRRA